MSKNFYFTFGDDRLDKFVKITAKDEKTARSRMFKECGRQWCTSYCEEDFLPNQGKEFETTVSFCLRG